MSFIGERTAEYELDGAHRALLETVGAAFAAIQLLFGDEVAGDFEIGYRLTKDIAKLTDSEKMSFHPRESGQDFFTIDVSQEVAADAAVAGAGPAQAPGACAGAGGNMAAQAAYRDDPAPQGNGPLMGHCCYWVWDPVQKQWICKAFC
jgi:hypothetical protein